MTSYSRVLGIDPSLTATGIATTYQSGDVVTSCVETTGRRGDSLEVRANRLHLIASHVAAAYWPNAEPVLMVIEGPAITRNAGSAWDRAGLWWRIVSSAYARGVNVAVCPPTTRAKWATDDGRADKAKVAAHLVRRFGVDIDSSDEADAAVLALMGAHELGWLAVQPAYSATALTKVRWPDQLDQTTENQP